MLLDKLKALFFKLKKLKKHHYVLITLLLIFLSPVIYSYCLIGRMAVLKKYTPVTTSLMRYRTRIAAKSGYRLKGNYVYVPLENISPFLVQAVIFAEDANFYHHHGIDTKALLESYQENHKSKKILHGGSTITMQLCKNLFLYPKKTYFRKTVEIILTVRMERVLSKPRILELYLNFIEWGKGIYGIELAARHYFHKTAKELDEKESAFLASLIINPRLYHPDRPHKALVNRKAWVYNYLTTGERTISQSAEEQASLMFFDQEEDDFVMENSSTSNQRETSATINWLAPTTAIRKWDEAIVSDNVY